MQHTKSESNAYPIEWDFSNSDIIYHNYNVSQVERDDIDGIDSTDGKPRIVYEYDVDMYSKDEYMTFLLRQNKADIERNRADIDFVMIMEDLL